MNELFRQCNWEGPAYLKLTNAVMERTPVVSTHDWYGTLGMLGGWETLDDAAQTAIEQMQRVQYDLARGEERAAQGKNS